MPKKKLLDLMREHALTPEESRKVSEAIQNSGSPIVIAILGSASVEQQLEVLLRSKMRLSNDDAWEKLTEESGPLGTFSRKIELGHAMKLFDSTLRDNLNTIRKVRNVFAHAKKVISFDHELIVSELRKVVLPPKKFSKRYRSLNLVRKRDISPDQAFVLLCLALENEFLRARLRSKTATLRNDRRKENKRPADISKPSLLFGLTSEALRQYAETHLPLRQSDAQKEQD